MAEIFFWLAGITGSAVVFSKIWDDLETPILRLVALGQVPGTELFLSFNQILVIALAIFSAWLIGEIVFFRRRLNRQVEQIAIELISL
ncbi:MAG TPA: hypothetical protein VGA08_02165 [Candidatus Saccharimonadales bacterium]